MSHLPAVAVIGVAAGGLALLHSLKRKREAASTTDGEAGRAEGDAAGRSGSAGSEAGGTGREGEGQVGRDGRQAVEHIDEDGASAGPCDVGGEDDGEEGDDASSLALLKNEFQRALVPPSRIDLDLDNFPYFIRYPGSRSSSHTCSLIWPYTSPVPPRTLVSAI